MFRFRAATLCVLCVVSSRAASAFADVSYTVTDLGTVGGMPYSHARSINASGQIVGYSNSNGMNQAFIYSNNVTSQVPGTSYGSVLYNSFANDINDSGKLVGSYISAGHEFAYVSFAGSTTNLDNVLGGKSNSAAYGINDVGQIVGEASWHAFLYSGGVATNLGALLPNSVDSIACDINDSGQVTGHASYAGASITGFLYSSGSMTMLEALPGGCYCQPTRLNNSGQIVGTSNTSSNNLHGFLYHDGEMIDLGTLGGGESQGNDINDSGQVVGTSNTSSGDFRAFVWKNGAMTDLNSLIASDSGWSLDQANAINDAGQIAGAGYNSLGQYHAFLLTPIPVPEPSSLVHLGIGAVGLLGYTRRRWREWQENDTEERQR
jgi:probable HAF family extracellular repeat protein